MRKNKTFTLGNWWFCVSWPLVQWSIIPLHRWNPVSKKYVDNRTWTIGFTFRFCHQKSKSLVNCG